MPPLPALVALLPGMPLVAPPPLPAPAPVQRSTSRAPRVEGTELWINGEPQQARWLLENGELWLPLEVLEGQLGVSRRGSAEAGLELEWFGSKLQLPANRQRSLDDEVAVPVAALLEAVGVRFSHAGRQLNLELPPAPLQAIRSRDLGISGRRVVLDLSSPAMVRSGEGKLLVGTQATTAQLQQLRDLGLQPSQRRGWLSLQVSPSEPTLTLAGPWRLVLDLPAARGSTATPTPAAPERDPRLAALQSQGLQLERRITSLGGKQLLVNAVRLDPQRVPLELKPLNRADGMQGLSSLSQLARQDDAVIAINGGYFNRVNRLPLGAMREQGRWLSGPILNRGALGWKQGELPLFDRLSLQDTIEDSSRQRWAVASVNSGYVQKGLARYTADWGSRYQPITGTEMGVLVRQGVVRQRFELGDLNGGVPLAEGDLLIVARGGVSVPWQSGERLSLQSRASSAVGDKPNVLGGGPLLLQNGQVVLNGSAEGFSSAFIAQGAPRTVVGSDGRQLWLITIQGVNNGGPTLLDTALLMRQEGLRDALNLDGGSSTGLVLADVHTVKGRGVAAAVHNGLGLVPRLEQALKRHP
ncbi:MAG: phosphodiester glycosidase family protein [Cyanobacteria bacterium M_surface_10_m2_179]|nr:phosphodiester glycosidase family protein [Cyanobacteria bacterium M_surface_10_m2_179]